LLSACQDLSSRQNPTECPVFVPWPLFNYTIS
jgi:hypothetical protein